MAFSFPIYVLNVYHQSCKLQQDFDFICRFIYLTMHFVILKYKLFLAKKSTIIFLVIECLDKSTR